MTSTRGVTRTGSILDKIVEDRRPVVERQQQDEPEALLRERFAEYAEHWSLTSAITSPRGNAPAGAAVQIVAEIKKASPSKGVLTETLDVEAIARAYALGGAAGISVLTEPNYFLGSLEHLLAARRMLERVHERRIAERGPDREFLTPSQRAREKQARNIGTCDEQYESDCGGKNQNCWAYIGDHSIL